MTRLDPQRHARRADEMPGLRQVGLAIPSLHQRPVSGRRLDLVGQGVDVLLLDRLGGLDGRHHLRLLRRRRDTGRQPSAKREEGKPLL